MIVREPKGLLVEGRIVARSGNPDKRARHERVRRALVDGGPGAVRSRFYCDESGNTGAHWGDPDQPTFVHGGWLIPVRNEVGVTDTVAELRRHHKLNAAELKWQQLARWSDPGAIFRDFVKAMSDYGCLPIFWVMDKDYITYAKVVETFFDPEYNKHYPAGFTAASDIRKELAEATSHAVDVRQDFAAMMRTGQRPSGDAIRELANRLADHFQAGNAPLLAASLRDFSDGAIAGIQGEIAAENWLRTTVGHSLPALAQLLEGFMRKHPAELEIVHDNLVRYEPAFDVIRGMFRPSDGTDYLMVGGKPFYGSMPTTTGLRLANSKTEPMIQMADLLCGFVRTMFAKIKDGQALTGAELTVGYHLAICRDQYSSWDANLPEWMWQEFAALTVGGVAKGEVEPLL